MSLEIGERIGKQKLKVKKTVFKIVRIFPKDGLEPSFVHWWEILKSIRVGCSNVGYRTGLLNLCTIAILGRMILCHGSCPVHCRILSSISGLYPLDASSTSHGVTTKNVPRCCQMV